MEKVENRAESSFDRGGREGGSEDDEDDVVDIDSWAGMCRWRLDAVSDDAKG